MTATPHRDVVAKMVFTDVASCCGSSTLWECWRENRVKAVSWNGIHTPTRYERQLSFDHGASNLITTKRIRQEKERTDMRYMSFIS
jgi:hypothetical protein